MMMRKMAMAALGVGAVMVLATPAVEANTITVSLTQVYECDATDASAQAGTGTYCWEYEIAVDELSRVSPGGAPGAETPFNSPEGVIADYFTVFDFVGFTGDAFSPADWEFQSLNVGSQPEGIVLAFGDDPNVPNLTWYYTGPGQQGEFETGGFIAVSIYGGEGEGEFGSEDTKMGGALDGSTNQARGFVPVPLQEDVPEPGSLLLMGMGLLGAAGAARRRMRK